MVGRIQMGVRRGFNMVFEQKEKRSNSSIIIPIPLLPLRPVFQNPLVMRSLPYSNQRSVPVVTALFLCNFPKFPCAASISCWPHITPSFPWSPQLNPMPMLLI